MEIAMTRLALAGLGFGLLCTASFALAQNEAVPVRTVGDTAYINGGIGDGEIAYMRENAPKYSLRMEFSERPDGQFVTDVNLAISDRAGAPIFALPSAGPLTDVTLPPGTYRVSASFDSQTKTQEVAVGGPGGKGKDISFNWNSVEPR
jgi:hypothetical protein